MSEKKSVRLNKLAKEFNVSMDRILSFLENKGVEGIKPSSKIPHELHMDLLSEFQPDLKAKIAADIATKERESNREEQRICGRNQNQIVVCLLYHSSNEVLSRWLCVEHCRGHKLIT